MRVSKWWQTIHVVPNLHAFIYSVKHEIFVVTLWMTDNPIPFKYADLVCFMFRKCFISLVFLHVCVSSFSFFPFNVKCGVWSQEICLIIQILNDNTRFIINGPGFSSDWVGRVGISTNSTLSIWSLCNYSFSFLSLPNSHYSL